MGVRFLTAAATLAWVMALAGARAGATPPPAAAGADLPEGAGRDVVERVCGDCHDVEVIETRLMNRAKWQAVVEDMIARGAAAVPGEETVILEYVFANFGVVNVNRAPQDDLVAVLRLTADEAKAIVDHRAKGEFTSLDDLKKVPGVDAAKLEARKDHIIFAGK